MTAPWRCALCALRHSHFLHDKFIIKSNFEIMSNYARILHGIAVAAHTHTHACTIFTNLISLEGA